MIIGNGMIAKALNRIDNDDTCFFASGVSNSTESDEHVFRTEELLLLKTIKALPADTTFVYFSSCLIPFETTPYLKHKGNMEKLIQARCSKYYIFRLPQVVGNSGNANTLFNFIQNKILSGETFQVWENVTRNLIDIDDVVEIIEKIILQNSFANRTLNIASPYNSKVKNLVKKFEKHLGTDAKHELVDKGVALQVDIVDMASCIKIDSLFLSSEDMYIEKLLKKYSKIRGK